MKKLYSFLKNDRLLVRIFLLSFFIILITNLYILVNYSKLPPLLPVFNQLPWGEQRLSKTLGIFIPSLIVVVVFVINLIASSLSYKSSPLLSRMLSITSFITALLCLLFIIRTITLII